MSERDRLMAARKQLDLDRLSEYIVHNGPHTTILSSNTASTESIVDLTDGENVSVHLRLRPISGFNSKKNGTYHVQDNDLITHYSDQVAYNPNKDKTEKHFSFTSILDEKVDQVSFYNQCVRPLISEIFNDRGATILCYGTSGSGKTFTILGDKLPGLVPRAIIQIFSEHCNNISADPCVKVDRNDIILIQDMQIEEEVALLQAIKNENKKEKEKKIKINLTQIQAQHQFEAKPKNNSGVLIWLSFVEVYNEKVVDLLAITNRQTLRPLKIISNSGNAYIKGLQSIFVSSIEDAIEVLQFGLRRVRYSETGINSNSSRSHTIFTLTIISSEAFNFTYSTYKFCDLAGAERVKKTHNTGERLKEAQIINSSLLVLGRCLDTVHQNQKIKNEKQKEIVPVRESKLTLLLQSSLLGKERFVMFVNLLPSIEFYEENLNVLNFAATAKKIIQRPAVMVQKRCTRYSLFMKHATNSPVPKKKERSNNSATNSLNISSSSKTVSLNDYVDDYDEMDIQQLREEIRRRDDEVDLYREHLYKAQEDLMLQEAKIKDEVLCEFKASRESDKETAVLRLEQERHVHQKRMENQKYTYEKKINNLEEENDELEEELEQLKKLVEKQRLIIKELSACKRKSNTGDRISNSSL